MVNDKSKGILLQGVVGANCGTQGVSFELRCKHQIFKMKRRRSRVVKAEGTRKIKSTEA